MSGDVVIERVLAAPIDMVWQMWTVGERFASWYGPVGATIPTAEIDAAVGGGRRVCMEMETPDGPMQMWFVGEYRVVDAPTRLVYTEAMGDDGGNATPGGPETEVVVELTEVARDATRVVMTHIGVPADSPGASGWQMALDKLAEALA